MDQNIIEYNVYEIVANIQLLNVSGTIYIIRIIIIVDYLHAGRCIHQTSIVYELMYEQWPYYEITFTMVYQMCVYSVYIKQKTIIQTNYKYVAIWNDKL